MWSVNRESAKKTIPFSHAPSERTQASPSKLAFESNLGNFDFRVVERTLLQDSEKEADYDYKSIK